MSLIFNHVYHSYDADTQLKIDALKDVSFKIEDGEFVGLIGHTGYGLSDWLFNYISKCQYEIERWFNIRREKDYD